MTPAIVMAKKAGIEYSIHTYTHDPEAQSYGLEAAEALGLEPGQVFKTLLVSLSGAKASLAVAIVPVGNQLDLKAMAKASGAKKVVMAEPQIAERITGYVVGGISPLGQKKQLPVVIDTSAMSCESVYVSAGKRGLEIQLGPEDLVNLCKAKVGSIAR